MPNTGNARVVCASRPPVVGTGRNRASGFEGLKLKLRLDRGSPYRHGSRGQGVGRRSSRRDRHARWVGRGERRGADDRTRLFCRVLGRSLPAWGGWSELGRGGLRVASWLRPVVVRWGLARLLQACPKPAPSQAALLDVCGAIGVAAASRDGRRAGMNSRLWRHCAGWLPMPYRSLTRYGMG